MKKISDLTPHPDNFITVEAKITTIQDQDQKGIRGVLGDASGVVDFYIIKSAIPEGLELKEGDIVRIVEGKCKVYDEHAYVSVAGGILRKVDNGSINVNDAFNASKDTYGKVTLDGEEERKDRGGRRTRGSGPRKSSSQGRTSERKNDSGDFDRRRNDRRDNERRPNSRNYQNSGELKQPEFIQIN